MQSISFSFEGRAEIYHVYLDSYIAESMCCVGCVQKSNHQWDGFSFLNPKYWVCLCAALLDFSSVQC